MSQMALECRASCPFNFRCGENFRVGNKPCVSVISKVAEVIKSDKGGRVALFIDGSAVGNGVKICIPKYENSNPVYYREWGLVAVAYNGFLEFRGSKNDHFAYPSI
jgi:hypothetical protein